MSSTSTTALALGTLTLAAALLPACTTAASHYTQRDPHGNYATSSDFNSMDRAEFMAAMHAGLRDFDARMTSLELKAQTLGSDALEEYEGDANDLQDARRLLDAELTRLDAILEQDDWEDLRDDIIDDYEDMREMLDDTFDEVLEEG
jgi:hypothetical protein